MKETMKDLLKSVVISICMAMTIFCLVGIVFDIGYKGSFSLEDYKFTKMVTGCVLIGLGFGVPTIVYRKESIPMPIKVLIHMGIGCTVMTGASILAGWLRPEQGLKPFLAMLGAELVCAFLSWGVVLLRSKKLAKQMNDRLREKQAS